MAGSDLKTANLQSIEQGFRSIKPTPKTFSVQFWGVRGGVPTPGPDTVRYGGNTPCVEIQVAGKRLIFDGGTGLRVLGKHLRKEMPVEAYIFFTHTHWDRIQGFPFFTPAFAPGNSFHIYGAASATGASIKQQLCDQMLRPNFPVPLRMMQSELNFVDIVPGSILEIGDAQIETISLNRPNSALGYRVAWEGHSVVYATEAERSPNQPDETLVYLAQQADVLIYDAVHPEINYFDPDAVQDVSRAWRSGIEVAIAAKAKKLVLFHHDPAYDDDFLDRVEAEAQTLFPSVQLAREGMVIDMLRS